MSANTGRKRANNEQYYTKDEVACKLVDKICEMYDLNSYTYVVEPSAGTGAFVKPLVKRGLTSKLLSYDIDPKYPNVKKQDFLTTVFSKHDKYIVIGNPPFGRQSCLAKRFIKHCCTFAEVICFILPRSFKKTSMSNCFPLQFHKLYEIDLVEKSFLFEGVEYSVPCVFQIWQKKDVEREVQPKHKCQEWYEIVKKTNKPNIAFRRVGGYAGKFIFDNFEMLSAESHYFIKCKHVDDALKHSLNTLTWITNNTTGPKSISKQELIEALNGIVVE